MKQPARFQADLPLDRATQRTWDAIVVGAGPAGALAAHQLARAGAAVLLIDARPFPRGKVCGCCLNSRALAALAASGLGGLVWDAGALPLNAFHVVTRRASAQIRLPAGAALSRARFDAALVRAAQAAGAAFLPETRAAVGNATEQDREVELRQPGQAQRVRARAVVIAAGLGSRLLQESDGVETVRAPGARVGAAAMLRGPWPGLAAGVIQMVVGKGGYAGLVRLPNERVNIAAALDVSYVKERGGLGEAVNALMESAGVFLPPGLQTLRWRGTPPLTQRATKEAASRAYVIGDAAGYVEPFTGEGMGWALVEARTVAPFVLAGLDRSDLSQERAWCAWYERAVRRRQNVCRSAAWLLRRPVTVEVITAAVARVPAAAAPVVRRVASPHVELLATLR